LDFRAYCVITVPFYENGHATEDLTPVGRTGVNEAKMKADVKA
jgi:hypothetical protein